jgi:hypothetical protein
MARTKKKRTVIRDRIKDFRRVRAGDLSPNPRNWRTHPKAQVEALRGVLSEIGYADALLARELPDGALELVDCHARQAMDPDQIVPVLVLDLDQDEADKLMTVLDPLAAMAEANATALESLLAEISTESDALQAMLDELSAQVTDEVVIEAPKTPESVAENIAEIDDIKRQHRQCDEGTASKNDTERYLVIVYGTREAREKAVESLGLPIDERYVAASVVDVRLKGKSIPLRFSDGVKRKAANKKNSGAGG